MKASVVPEGFLDCLSDLSCFGVAVPDRGVMYGQILLHVAAPFFFISRFVFK